jgi:ABC-2 type transport system permease protein
MNISRAIAVAQRVFADLSHDRRALAILFITPLGFMVVFGLAFQGNVQDVHVLVVNNDQWVGNSSMSNKIISNFDKDVLNVGYASNESDAIASVQNGNAYAVIVFPADFTQIAYASTNTSPSGNLSVANTATMPMSSVTNPTAVQSNQTHPPAQTFQGAAVSANQTLPTITSTNAKPQQQVSISVLEDKSNVDVANAITSSVNAAVLQTMNETGQTPHISVDTNAAIYGANARFIDFFCPGIISLAVWNLTTLLTLQAFVTERGSGTLLRMLASPLRESELVIGYSMAYGVLGVAQSAVLLVVGVLLFHVALVGNVMLAFATIALLAVVSQALGILLSSVARTEREAGEFAPFLILFAVLLSGIIWPLEAIPAWLRPASYLLPTTYAVEAMRAVMMRGWGLEQIWIDIVALLVFAVVFMSGAIIMLRRRS